MYFVYKDKKQSGYPYYLIVDTKSKELEYGQCPINGGFCPTADIVLPHRDLATLKDHYLEMGFKRVSREFTKAL